jgi:hypothetical protein
LRSISSASKTNRPRPIRRSRRYAKHWGNPCKDLLALIPLVLQVLPKLAPIFGTPLSGGVLDKAGQVAKEVFGTIDAAQIQLQIEQEKRKLEEFKAGVDAATKEEQAYFADVQSARAQTMALAQVQSPIAYGAPIMSGLVTVGFIVVLILFVSYALQLDAYQQSVVTDPDRISRRCIPAGGQLLAGYHASVAREGHCAGVACWNGNAGGAT